MRTQRNWPLLKAGLASIVVINGAFYAVGAAAQDVRSAQNANNDLFARDRAVSVRERDRPDYKATGLPLGAFTVYPKAQTDIEYNDNVFAAANNAQSGAMYRIRPEIMTESDWVRHYLSATVRGSLNRNIDFDTENTEEWSVLGRGRLDVSRQATITASADTGHAVEPRTSTNTALAASAPIEYDQSNAFVAAAWTQNRLRFSTRADVQKFDYEDGRSLTGVVIEQDDRDRVALSMFGRVDYALSPATAVFAQLTGNKRDYDSTIPGVAARDSDGYEALTGVNFEVGAVNRGEIAVGYIVQNFKNATYGDIDGFGARGQFEWFPTELTTVTTTVARTVEDAAFVGAAGYMRSEGIVNVDHELLRNLILNGRFGYSKDAYNGIDRDVKRTTATVGATYLLNRNLGLSGSVVYLDQSSEGSNPAPVYNVTRFVISLVTQF